MDVRTLLVSPDATLLETVGVIDAGKNKIALVVDDQGRLMGTVSDGDIRRALLRGMGLSDPIEHIVQHHPVTIHPSTPPQQALELMRARRLDLVPVVDEDGRLAGVETLHELIGSHALANWAVVMAGGLGKRLGDLTKHCPKPLLKVGGRPILEIIVEGLVNNGFKNIVLSVNYKAEMIEEHFGDGQRFGVRIHYLREDKPLGTAGALSLLPERPDHPFIVMNGDILTQVNYRNLIDFHLANKAMACMGVKQHQYQIQFGVVQLEGHDITGITEKPEHNYFVNAGIYVLEPDTLDLIPRDTFFDMPTLFDRILETKGRVCAFPIHEYWLDIGRRNDYEQANLDYFDKC